MKKRQHAQVMAKAHGKSSQPESMDTESGYSSDHDSEGERELVIAEFDAEETTISKDSEKIEAHFKFSFNVDDKLVMEEVAHLDLSKELFQLLSYFRFLSSKKSSQ